MSGWPTTSTGRSRATATGARRCRSGGAVGATCAASGRWPSSRTCAGATSPGIDPAPARHRRGHLRLLDLRGARANDDELAVARRVEPVIDAWFDSGSMPAAQVGYPHAPGLGGGLHVPGRLHLRGHRPDPRLVLLPAGRQHAGLRREPLPPRRLPRATSSTPTGARCPSRSATSSTPGRSSTPGAPTPCAGGCSARARRGRRPGRRLGAIDTAMRDMLLTLWNTFSFFTTYASLNGFDPADPAIPAAGRPRSARPLDPLPPGQHDGEVTDGARRPTSRSTRPTAARRPRRRPLQLVRAAQPASFLAHRSRRAGRRHAWPPRPRCTRS